MLRRVLLIVVACLLSGCELFDRILLFHRHSSDENGKDCATYEIKSDRVYETICTYGGAYPGSVKNPLSRQ